MPTPIPATTMTDRGLLALARHEGLVPAPYLDAVDTWTFGIGHTAAAGDPDPETMPRGMPDDMEAGIAEAFRVFRADIAPTRPMCATPCGCRWRRTSSMRWSAFHYNTGGIARAALTRHLNAGNRVAAADAFMGWRDRRRSSRAARPSSACFATGSIRVAPSRSGPWIARAAWISRARSAA